MSKSKSPAFSVRDFFQRFPDDEACLTHIMEVRFGMKHVCRKCGVDSTFHRMTERRAFACASCGDHVYPTAGTVFEDTRTPLQLWFYAIYLFVTTRHGVSGKELQRQLGVTYKTAWRMGMKIRELIGGVDGFEMLAGHVELDEAYVGGRRKGKRGRGAEGKTVVVGMKERGGKVRTEVIPNVKKDTLRGVVLRNVETGATVSTDELMSYGLLEGDGYTHGRVKHSDKEWAIYDYRTDETYSTNHVESFWKLFKASVRSTHIHVSSKYMDRYLNEFAFRSNHRDRQNAMFDLIVSRV
ncbi:IS1595 family transposase [Oceaniradius stylonematis]|uniref:IS1595 family transposase n=1 Tax=Oceaniradius stylonematis TaxID=2184161 RepID=UPI00273F372E|nr:IS1595 family transposase [Oceaniradius stylonematis]